MCQAHISGIQTTRRNIWVFTGAKRLFVQYLCPAGKTRNYDQNYSLKGEKCVGDENNRRQNKPQSEALCMHIFTHLINENFVLYSCIFPDMPFTLKNVKQWKQWKLAQMSTWFPFQISFKSNIHCPLL